MDKLYIVIPAYNEEKNIADVIAAWYPVVEATDPASRLLILNDGSRDRTFEKAVALKDRYPNLEVINKPNSGHGPTCLFGYQYAIDAGADYVFQTDSDGQTNPAEFDQFWRHRTAFNFLIGVRQHRQDGFSRKIVTNVLRFILRLTFGTDVRDANTPYRLMNAKTLSLYLAHIPRDFFLGNALLTAAAVKRNDSVKWMPITFKPRQGGENSINLKKICKIGVKSVIEFVKFVQARKEFLNGARNHAGTIQKTISQ
jgi:dolichol-phosphate mannosyltransferase